MQPYLRWFTGVALVLVVLSSGFAADERNPESPPGPRVRPATWAAQVLNAPIVNWWKVDDRVYRCAQPDDEGMKALQDFGVRSVLNLRMHHSDADEAKGTTLKLERVKADAGDLSYAQVIAALRVIAGASATAPIAVHCWHGSDRTGAIIAAYRIAAHGWTPATAADEMIHGGFGHHEYYGNLRRLILALDPARLRADSGLTLSPIAAAPAPAAGTAP